MGDAWAVVGSAAAVAVALAAGGLGLRYSLARRRWRAAFARALRAVRADPARHTLHLELLRIAGDAPAWAGLPLERAYRTALDLLATSPRDFDLRVLALALGQMCHGRRRPTGRATAEDVAAVQKQISARAT